MPVRYDWFYRASNNTFKSLPSLTPPFPADLVQTTTIDGLTVNYIVRVESGTLNQSIYRIAIIDDPTNPISNPWSVGGKKPGPGWNGKLSFPFGGGCGPAFRSGRNAVTSALSDNPLSLGFAVAFGTRNTLGNGCDFVVSAETVMMIKERFVEQYGVPKFTIGSGGSGGAMQQHFIAQNYPGLLDAITPGISYPDLVSILPDVTDCGLLNNYFDNALNARELAGLAACQSRRLSCKRGRHQHDLPYVEWVRPLVGESVQRFRRRRPGSIRYDPITNPTGARGSFTDGMVNVFGIDPRPALLAPCSTMSACSMDLNAVNKGDITVDEFLDLNERIGGLDVDGNYIPQRSAANLQGIGARLSKGCRDIRG